METTDLDPELTVGRVVQDYSAKPVIDGVRLIELKLLVDDGGWFLELGRLTSGLLDGLSGFDIRQLNCSELLFGAVKATHLHLRQEDVWFVPPSQRLLVALRDVRRNSPTRGVTMRFVLGAGRARLLFIPRGVAHGAANPYRQPALLFYFVNQIFSPDPAQTDEHRLPPDILGERWWEITRG